MSQTFYYSQLALSTYQSCQLKFCRRYLDELYWPRPVDEEVELGENFHLLSQRYFSTGEVAADSSALELWIQRLQDFRPFQKGISFFPEQELRLNDSTLRLVARYDLVAVPDTGKVLIYDWKTDQRKPEQRFLENSLQTVVYRYLLVRASAGCLARARDVDPAEIVMIYWNPRFPESPVVLPYDEDSFQQDEKILQELIAEIEGKEPEDFFPTADEKVCARCEYSPICKGTPSPLPVDVEPDELSLSWDDIQDLPY